MCGEDASVVMVVTGCKAYCSGERNSTEEVVMAEEMVVIEEVTMHLSKIVLIIAIVY